MEQGNDNDPPVQTITTENIEINNTTTPTDNNGINNEYGLEITQEVKNPEVKEIHIKQPTAEPKKTLLPKPEKKEFVF